MYRYGRNVSMKINAVIESKDGGTLVLDFPCDIYDVYEKLQSVGIRKSPHQITLSDEDGDDVRVKLYSESDGGKHLLLTLNEQNSLADVNMLAFMVNNAKPDFRLRLEQNLIHDQYGSMQEVTDTIKHMLYESGPVKAVFYCPLVGEIIDNEGFGSPVDGRFLKSYAWAVEEATKKKKTDFDINGEPHNMLQNTGQRRFAVLPGIFPGSVITRATPSQSAYRRNADSVMSGSRKT